MKLQQLFTESEEVKPEVKYRQNGDKSWTVRVDYGNGKVYTHTNKRRQALVDLVKEKYGPRKFVM